MGFRWQPTAVSLTVALFAAAPCLGAPTPWTFGISGGYVPGYTHQSVTHYGTIFSPGNSLSTASLPATWIGSLSAGRRVTGSVSLRLEVSYLAFEGGFKSLFWDSYSGSSGDPAPTGSLEARFVPAGLGLRFVRRYPGWRTHVFLDATPLVVWSEYASNTARTAGGEGVQFLVGN